MAKTSSLCHQKSEFCKEKKKNNDTVRVEENKKTYCLDMLDININLYLSDTLDIIFFQMDINVF